MTEISRNFKETWLPILFGLIALPAFAENDSVSEAKVYLTFREVTLPSKKAEEIGFDWLFAAKETTPKPQDPEQFAVTLDSREKLFDVLRKKKDKPTASIFRHADNDAIIDISEKNRENMQHTELGKIAGVFTDPQAQVMFRALKKKGIEPVTAPAILVDSGQPGLVQNGKKQWAVIPTIAADLYTLDLEIFLTGYGEGLFQREEVTSPDAKIAIWDGQTVAVNAGKRFGKHRTIFITARMMNTDGTPLGTERRP